MKTSPLKALEKYYKIKRTEKLIEIRCKHCSKAWVLSPQKEFNFNPLGLYDHAFMHEDAGKLQEECVE